MKCRPLGWLATFPTPVKVAHLAANPRGVGYPPGRYWQAPEHETFAVLRLEPYRVQALRP